MTTNPEPWPAFVPLTGEHVRLEFLSHSHAKGLTDAVRDGEAWRLWYTSVPSPETMHDEIERRLALRHAGAMLPYTVLSATTGEPVGMTTYMNIDAANKRLEIGSTWYRDAVRRTPLNTEAKYLMLSHAFETLDCIAVEFRTHFFNHQSRRAIERLGAKFDGLLRNHSRAGDGTLRDTCVYSIIASEWAAVRSHLRWQLAKPRPK